MHRRHACAAAAFFVAAMLCARPAGALDADGYAGWARAQVQYIILGSMGDMGAYFGGLEAQVNLSLASVGLAAGLRFDRVLLRCETCGRIVQGGAVDLALQWRPLHLLGRRLTYTMVDLHADLGFVFGGLRDGGDSLWRTAVYVGGALDFTVPLKPMQLKTFRSSGNAMMPDVAWTQIVFSVQFRHMLVQEPCGAPEDEVLLGAGIRVVM